MEHPIEGGVGKKNHAGKLQDRHREQGSEDVEADRQGPMVDEIVEPGAGPRAGQVAQHPDIRGEQQQREPPPGVADPREQEDRQQHQPDTGQPRRALVIGR